MTKLNWSKLKREKEKKQIQLFKDCFVQIKEAKIGLVENDSPDFSLEIANKKISIEITELIWNEDKDGANKKAQESTANYIMNSAQMEYEKLNLPPVQVNISFVDQYGLLKDGEKLSLNSSDKKRLPKYILEKVIENLPQKSAFIVSIDDYNQDWERVLDKKISHISIMRFPELTDNCWAADGGGAIPSLCFDKINDRISEKNKTLPKYKFLYDESWLLIVEDWEGISGYFIFRNEILDIKYKSEVDRIFILRSSRREVIELNIER